MKKNYGLDPFFFLYFIVIFLLSSGESKYQLNHHLPTKFHKNKVTQVPNHFQFSLLFIRELFLSSLPQKLSHQCRESMCTFMLIFYNITK